jgi:hypothetical protein
MCSLLANYVQSTIPVNSETYKRALRFNISIICGRLEGEEEKEDKGK